MQLFKIGVITKTQGLKGEVRAKILQNQNHLIENKSYIYLNDEKYLVNKITNRNTFVVLKLDGFNSINEVQNIINSDIYIEKTKEVLSDDEFLIKEVIDFDVVDETGKILGKITDILNYGAGDVYGVSAEAGSFMFVNSRNVIIDFDFNNKQLVVNSEILHEIAVLN